MVYFYRRDTEKAEKNNKISVVSVLLRFSLAPLFIPAIYQAAIEFLEINRGTVKNLISEQLYYRVRKERYA